MDVAQQLEIDRLMIELDGTPNKAPAGRKRHRRRLAGGAQGGRQRAPDCPSIAPSAASTRARCRSRSSASARAAAIAIRAARAGSSRATSSRPMARAVTPRRSYWSWRCAEETKRLLRARYPDKYSPAYHSTGLAGVIDDDRELLEIMSESIVRCGYEGRVGIYFDCGGRLLLRAGHRPLRRACSRPARRRATS